jgi:hypothetical protein
LDPDGNKSEVVTFTIEYTGTDTTPEPQDTTTEEATTTETPEETISDQSTDTSTPEETGVEYGF